MYPVQAHDRILGGEQVTTYSCEIYRNNVLRVEAGTNGYKGGDSGHGSRTFFRIDSYGTDIEVKDFTLQADPRGFEVSLGGDNELETMIVALEFILKVFKDEIKGQNWS